MSNSNSSSGGIGCLSVIGIVFVVLKVLSIEPVASWSWLWVLAPFWIGLAIFFAILAVVFIVAMVAAWLKE